METTSSATAPPSLSSRSLRVLQIAREDAAVDIIHVHGPADKPSWKPPKYDAIPWTWGPQVWDGNHLEGRNQHTDALQEAHDMLDALASERKRLKRTNKPIIFVAYSLGGILVKRALLLQGNSSSEKDDYWRSIRERTYGVISVGSTRRGQFPKTLSLAAGQLASYTVLRNYENCHGAAFTNHQSPVQPRWLSKQSLDEFLKVLQTPPTTPFVLVALAYGVSATLQYHINRADRLQQLFLIIGLALGAWKTLPFFTNPDQEPRLVSALSLSVTISMLCSACGHWIWRTLCRKPAVIDLMLEEWVLDASTSTNESRGIRFHEIG